MVFFLHYCNYYVLLKLISCHSLAKRPRQGSYYKSAKCLRTLCLYQESVLVLQVSQVTYDLVPSRLVSSTLLSPTCSAIPHICLSQAYGCSDRYITDKLATMACLDVENIVG